MSSSKRPRIYALVRDCPRLDPSDHSHVVEARLLTALSTFADVYYNNQKFEPRTVSWGLTGDSVSPPTRPYDLHYVRDNPAIFLRCPAPRITQALPHDAGVYYEADALFVESGRLKRALEKFAKDRSGPQIVRGLFEGVADKLPPLIHAPLVSLEPIDEPSARQLITARAMMTFGDVIGYFGARAGGAPPDIFTAAYQEVRRLLPRLQLVVDRTFPESCPAGVHYIAPPTAAKEAAYLHACAALVADEGPITDILPARQIGVAIAARVPIIAKATDAHIEQLGIDYPLLYTDQTTAARRILEAIFDRDVIATARKILARQEAAFAAVAVGENLHADLSIIMRNARAQA